MFKNLLSKLAGKAGLSNIQYDLNQLKLCLRQDPARASKLIFSISDQICFALANHVPEQEVNMTIGRSYHDCSVAFRKIVNLLFSMDVAILEDDQPSALRLEQEMKEAFLLGTAFPLDYSQGTFFPEITQGPTTYERQC